MRHSDGVVVAAPAFFELNKIAERFDRSDNLVGVDAAAAQLRFVNLDDDSFRVMQDVDAAGEDVAFAALDVDLHHVRPKLVTFAERVETHSCACSVPFVLVCVDWHDGFDSG